MKNIIGSLLLLTFLSSFQGKRQDIKLEGNYRMEFETEYSTHNCNIKIDGDKYIKTLNNKSKRKGSVELIKKKFGQEFILKEKGSELEVIVEGTTFRPSDTIYFRTKKVNEKDNENDLVISSGKLIKIR